MTVTGRVISNTKRNIMSNKSSTPKNRSRRLLDEVDQDEDIIQRKPSVLDRLTNKIDGGGSNVDNRNLYRIHNMQHE
jgi:hypothetical protein